MTVTPGEELSARELEVLARVVTGATNRQVATELDISPNTVKVHVSNILAKLGAQSRAEATRIALERGLVEAQDSAPGADEAEHGEVATPPTVNWPLPPAAAIGMLVALVAVLVIALWPLWSHTEPETLGARMLDAPGEASESAEATGARWRSRLDMPTARARLAVAALDGTLYAIGGQTADGPVGTVEVYYTDLDLWGRGATKPTPTANIGAVVLDDLIFVPGGLQSNGALSNALEIYNPRLDAWAQAAPMPVPLCSYALTTWEEGFYLLGGWDGEGYVDTVYYYDVGTDTWHEAGRLPMAQGFGAAATLGRRIYLTGGYDGQTELATCLSFAPGEAAGDSLTWVRHADMGVGRAGHGMAVANGSLYVCGGGWEQPFAANERYDARLDAWSSYESPITGEWRTLGLTAVDQTTGTFLYALGGWSGAYRSSVYAYQAFYRVYLP